MPRRMYDSVKALSILQVNPKPQMVAGYVDKIVIPPWTPSDWGLFPDAVKVQIVKKASSIFGDVLDVEKGDATPAEAPGWVQRRRQAGHPAPCVYCSLSVWASVQQEFNSQHVAQPLYWIAQYNDVPNFPVLNGITAIAKQYHGNDPANYDLSIVADYWPGVDSKDNDMELSDNVHMWNDDQGHPRTATVEQCLASSIGHAEYIEKELSKAVGNLTQLIIADDKNDVTAEAVADLVSSRITAEITPLIQNALNNVTLTVGPLNDADKAALTKSMLDGLYNRLGQ